MDRLSKLRGEILDEILTHIEDNSCSFIDEDGPTVVLLSDIQKVIKSMKEERV